MDEQEHTPKNAIPPKVTPFVKTDNAKPAVTPAKDTPRPITVRLKPVAPPAATAAPSPAAAQPPATDDKPADGAPAMTPVKGAPRPITVRLKPVAPTATPAQTPAASQPPATDDKPADGAPTVVPATSPRATSRVPVPELDGDKDDSAIRPATIRLRPVTPPTAPATTPENATPAAKSPVTTPITASSRQPQPPPTPGSHPLPKGLKPPSPAQTQAAKSKTSRISLDSAIGVAPTSPMGANKNEPKTIRLKRPSNLIPPASPPKSSTTPIRQTSRIPDSALPTAEAGSTQKKTLKIKRPSLKPEGQTAGAEDAFPDGVELTPINPADFQEAGSKSKVFTTIAVIASVTAAIVLLLLTLCLGAHAMGPNAGKNALATIKGPDLPWTGKISN